MGITAIAVNACQCNMKKDTRRKFSSSSGSVIMNGGGYFYIPVHNFKVFMAVG